MPGELEVMLGTTTLVVVIKDGLKPGWDSPDDALDVLELFAFIRPAQMLSPTPGGLAGRLGLPQPATAEDKILAIAQAATQLLDELADISDPQRGKLAEMPR